MLGDKAGGAFGLSDVEEGGKGVSKNEYMFFGKLKYGLHSVNEYNDIMKLIDIYTLVRTHTHIYIYIYIYI